MRDGVYAFAPEEAKGYKFRFLSRFPISITLKASFTLPKKKDTWNAHVLEAGAQSLYYNLRGLLPYVCLVIYSTIWPTVDLSQYVLAT